MNVFIKKSTVLFLVFFISCEAKDKTTHASEGLAQKTLAKIDILDANTGNLSSFIEEVRVLQLDTMTEALVAMPGELLFDDEAIYILDTYRSKAIYSFDMLGNLSYKIERYGNGPGEYTLLNTISTYKNILIGWAADRRKLLHFEKSTGRFLEELNLNGEYLVSGITHTQDGGLILINYNYEMTEESNSLYLLDSTLLVKGTLNDAGEMNSDFIVSSLAISKSKESNPIYKHPLHDIVYEITGGEVAPKYRVVLPESDLLTEEDLLLEDEDLFRKVEEENLYVQSRAILHASSFVSIGLIKGHDLNHGLLYSKTTQNVLDYSKINNDIFEFDLPVPIATYQDCMVFVIEPEGMEDLETIYKAGAERFALPNSSKTIQGNLGLVFIKFKF